MIDPTIYFGKAWEPVTHIGIHFAIGLWREDYSLVAAIAIEGADTLNGKFELLDIVARLGGVALSHIFKMVF